MIYFFQSLSLKTRFLGVILSFLVVLGFWWLLTAAPWALAYLRAISQGAGLPDFGLWSPPEALQNLLERWGPDGRWQYLTVMAPTNLGFLLSYGIFLSFATLYLLKKSNPAARWYLLPLLPLAAAGFEFLENAALIAVVLLPRQESDWIAVCARIFTTIQGWTFVLSLVVLVVGSVISLIRKGVERYREVVSNDEPGPKPPQ